MQEAVTLHNDKKLLSIQNIHKSFGLNQVLKGINLEIARGELLSLIGGNGAGKSTLMKIIMGIYQPDQGEIYIDGKVVYLNKPSVALSNGIYMVPQEPMLFPNMSVEENIVIGFQENAQILHKRLLKIMEEVGWKIELERKASSLSIAEQQLVEILRGLLREAQILILDEPTSSLTFDEVKSLFKCVKELRNKGIGIIYITHRLTEVFEISTSVAIMRDGVITLCGAVDEFTKESLIFGLLPSNKDNNESKGKTKSKGVDYKKSKPVMEIENYSGYGFNNISLKLYPGEILGVAGVVGAGRTELATTIFGKDKVLSGRVLLDGKDITGYSTEKVVQAGLNYVPEDRHLHGLFGIADAASNMTSSFLKDRSMGRIILNKKREREITQKYIDDFRIKVTGQSQMAGSLSGGNQQKIVIGRSLATSPRVVILDEPTRGIDAGARNDVYAIIQQLKSQGVAVLLISSDMEEIVELSDRAVSVFQGHINAEFTKEEINQDNLMAAAFDVKTGKGVMA